MISLSSAIKNCQVSDANAHRVQSTRTIDPNTVVCPAHNGTDTTGRPVCPNSVKTKTAGCNSALDRVHVESSLRPNYASYINLGVTGPNPNAAGFGTTTGLKSHIYPTCPPQTVENYANRRVMRCMNRA